MKAPVHLNALRAFEASARHLSFSAAAQELHVTPAAVGQLVRTLEDWLGAPLFYRAVQGRSRLALTETAESALPDIRAGLDRLALGLQRLKEGVAPAVLTVTVSPAFASKWLLPRIESFQAACPDLDLRLDTNLRPVDLAAQRIDAGVRYGAGSWPGLQAECLMQEEVFPVCSPLLLQRFQQPVQAEHLLNQTLIHDVSMDVHVGFPTWASWFRDAGVPEQAAGTLPAQALARGLKINNSAAVLQAAMEGQGIALARSVMVHDDVAAGRLVRLCPHIRVLSPLAYYLVYRPESSSLPRVLAFRAWLLGQLGDSTSASTPRLAASSAPAR